MFKPLKILLLFTISIFLPIVAFAQYTNYGSDRGSIKWNSVEGEKYKVVYPRGCDSLGLKYLWLLERDKYKINVAKQNINQKRLPVILHTESAYSNGLVVWAPRRMELWTQPNIISYPVLWDEQLSIHEGTHVSQLSFFSRGIFKPLRVVFGEQIEGLGMGLYTGRWFLEGDAVIAETEFSNSGRGRNASFMEYYRTSLLEGEKRSWDRWRYGSYKYYTPDIYALGYILTSTIRTESNEYDYSAQLLKGVVDRFYNPFGDEVVFKRLMGMSKSDIFYKGLDKLEATWREELANRGELSNPIEVLNKKKKSYSEYDNLVSYSVDSLLYVKSSFNTPSRLILFNGEKEKVLRPFASGVNKFAAYMDEIIFSENVPHARWENVVYSNLYSYNIKSNIITPIIKRRFIHNGVLSADGGLLVAVENLKDGSSRIIVEDIEKKESLKKINPPYNGEVKDVVWHNGEIYATVITKEGLGIYKIGLNDENWQEVVKGQNSLICDLNSDKSGLYFLSDIDGVNNIYLLNDKTGEFKRLTNSKYGASNPFISGDTLYYIQTELNGKYPVKIAISTLPTDNSKYSPSYNKESKILKSNYRYIIADSLSAQAKSATKGVKEIENFSSLEEFKGNVEIKKYRKGANLFRIHSWAPVFYDVDELKSFSFDDLYKKLALGATIYSQNTLGTAVAMGGYSYHKGLHAGHLRFTYSGWYPVIKFSADINQDKRYLVKMVNNGGRLQRLISYNSKPLVELQATTYIPFNISSHGWNRFFIPQVGFSFNNNEFYSYELKDFKYRYKLASTLQYSQHRNVSHGGIFPKFGFGGSISGVTYPRGGENFASVTSAYLYGYLPGFLRNDGFKIALHTQKQYIDNKLYYADNLAYMPRGFDSDIYAENYSMCSLDYALPIYLGDVNWGRVAYFKRLQLVPFIDYAVLDKSWSNKAYSAGATLMVDSYLLRIGVPVSFGFRYSYNRENVGLLVNKNKVELMFSVDLQ